MNLHKGLLNLPKIIKNDFNLIHFIKFEQRILGVKNIHKKSKFAIWPTKLKSYIFTPPFPATIKVRVPTRVREKSAIWPPPNLFKLRSHRPKTLSIDKKWKRCGRTGAGHWARGYFFIYFRPKKLQFSKWVKPQKYTWSVPLESINITPHYTE